MFGIVPTGPFWEVYILHKFTENSYDDTATKRDEWYSLKFKGVVDEKQSISDGERSTSKKRGPKKMPLLKLISY